MLEEKVLENTKIHDFVNFLISAFCKAKRRIILSIFDNFTWM